MRDATGKPNRGRDPPSAYAEQEVYRLRPGDVLLSEASGSPDEVGKPVVWRGELENCCFQNTVIRFRPRCVQSAYAHIVFNHFARSGVFAKTSKGVGIQHLSADRFAQLPLPLPPLSEQEAIVAKVEQQLSDIAATEDYIAASLKRAGRLRQSILKEAFAGRLVPQDPADEPAYALLDRIRQARAAADGTAPGAGKAPRRRVSSR
jgi:type I restriction enzyme S subunit